ncbi:hypothetical protein BRARA_F03316 [Brassica rapa]|uniref:Sinigrinase n=1 Tax=Brassica campestris TaxID=3711 RepID=A0A397Z362_BRACM|nr:hypothetical protein BRARA_F03316 [Brassica rapa]
MKWLQEDVQLMMETGLDAYRFSISWSRLIPNGRGPVNPKDGRGPVNPKGLQFYKNFIELLVNHGIQPHVTLYHYDHPQYLENEYGGWLNRKTIEFGNHVKFWTTINEANIYTIGGYSDGLLPPGHCSSRSKCSSGNSSTGPYIVGHNLLLAHASASRLYKQKIYREVPYVGFSVFTIGFTPSTSSTNVEIAVQIAKAFIFGWMLGPLTYGDYPDEMKRIVGSRLPVFTEEESALVKGSSDFVGVIHYLAASVTSVTHYAIVPWVMEAVLECIKESYGNPPVYILENGTPMKQNLQDTPRIEFLHAYIGAVLNSITGYEYSFGLYFVNFSDPHRTRTPKLSAHWYSAFLKDNTTFLGSQGIAQLQSNFSSPY